MSTLFFFFSLFWDTNNLYKTKSVHFFGIPESLQNQKYTLFWDTRISTRTLFWGLVNSATKVRRSRSFSGYAPFGRSDAEPELPSSCDADPASATADPVVWPDTDEDAVVGCSEASPGYMRCFSALTLSTGKDLDVDPSVKVALDLESAIPTPHGKQEVVAVHSGAQASRENRKKRGRTRNLVTQWYPVPFLWFLVTLRRSQPHKGHPYYKMATGLPREAPPPRPRSAPDRGHIDVSAAGPACCCHCLEQSSSH